MPRDTDPIVLRSSFAWVWTGLAIALSAYLLIDMGIRASVWDAFLVAPWLLLVCWVVWLFQVVPRIEADERGARVYNLLRILDLPWSAVASVRLRYHTEFTLRSGETVTAWGGSSRRLHLSIKHRSAEDPAMEEADALQRLHANAVRDPSPARRRWNAPALAALVVIVVWIVFSLMQTGGIVIPGVM